MSWTGGELILGRKHRDKSGYVGHERLQLGTFRPARQTVPVGLLFDPVPRAATLLGHGT